MIIMAIDIGEVRTGLAVCDSGESFAFPRGVIHERNRAKLVEKIVLAMRENNAELIVAGLPKNMDGSEGFKAQECREVAEQVAAASGLPLEMQDERLTTVSAHIALESSEISGKKRKNVVDTVAATIILENFLTKRKQQSKGD